MAMPRAPILPPNDPLEEAYRLDAQIGFLLRKANQRHLALFTEEIPEVTPRQFAALAKLLELGPLSQNRLGRATAMDAATIKGVIGRLLGRDLVTTTPDPEDRRRLTVALSESGRSFIQACLERAQTVSTKTLAPLSAEDSQQILALIKKLAHLDS